jgi:Xaa-Pro aminopeptidase
LERLTCLVVPAPGEPFLIVPALELPSAQAIDGLDIELVPYAETDDAYAMVANRLAGPVSRVAVDNHMWADKVMAFKRVLPQADQCLAAIVLSDLRMHKAPEEVDALRRAANAIDDVHRHMSDWLRKGRTERQVAADLRDAMISAGHASAEFAIVASGPNAASPHHDASDRIIGPGDPVVVDIGGTMPDGYCSDCTRTYTIGEPAPDFVALYQVLHRAQSAQTDAVRPGITAAQLDAVGRDIIAEAGYGTHFTHRTGHGIGLDVHEEPYIVAGSPQVLEPGMTFSVEPGIYVPDRHGARIEDIVVCTRDGGERLNVTERGLTAL